MFPVEEEENQHAQVISVSFSIFFTRRRLILKLLLGSQQTQNCRRRLGLGRGSSLKEVDLQKFLPRSQFYFHGHVLIIL